MSSKPLYLTTSTLLPKLNYAAVSYLIGNKPDSKNKVTALTTPMTCREALVSSVKSLIDSNSLADDKTRLVVLFNSPPEKAKGDFELTKILSWMKKSVAIINIYERTAGWSLTTVEELKYSENQDANAWLFEGSRRWLKSPQLFSFFVLMIRIARNPEFSSISFKTHADIKRILTTSEIRFDSYYSRSVPAWEVLVRNYGELFRQKKRTYYWDVRRLSSSSAFIGSEGIHALTFGKTYDKELNKKFQEILEKEGLADEIRATKN